ncbi:hypothetical protein EJ03DRAFT_124577 [Teratosphaeria nubilosa]|uniref:Uncharacterized protein n=1 Tax=Teratosphaeria nubilosa TaxID=161662 RepID=A0A6G1LM50_9PEZI|nr:hypothetical protein EJ03DRAFT_124577 [Teratosphaeria nubilosa]
MQSLDVPKYKTVHVISRRDHGRPDRYRLHIYHYKMRLASLVSDDITLQVVADGAAGSWYYEWMDVLGPKVVAAELLACLTSCCAFAAAGVLVGFTYRHGCVEEDRHHPYHSRRQEHASRRCPRGGCSYRYSQENTKRDTPSTRKPLDSSRSALQAAFSTSSTGLQ